MRDHLHNDAPFTDRLRSYGGGGLPVNLSIRWLDEGRVGRSLSPHRKETAFAHEPFVIWRTNERLKLVLRGDLDESCDDRSFRNAAYLYAYAKQPNG